MAPSGPTGPERGPADFPGDGGARPTGTPTFDETGLLALGDQVHQARTTRNGRHSHSGHSRRRHRRLWWALGAVGVVVVILVGSTAGYAWYLNHEIHRLDVKGLTDVPTSGAEAGTQNILLVGSTDRCALSVQNAAYGLCSEGVNGVNSDVVMILHLNPANRSLSILSIPRDLFIPNARSTGANKIDAALYDGPSQLVAALHENLGISIQHYVVLNFDTFANVVNDLGGVKMYFPEPVYDEYSGLRVLTTGCISLDGVHALQVVRARHLQYKGPGITASDPYYWPYEAESDLARIRRDHEFLRVLGTAVSKNGLSNPVTDEKMISSVVPQLEVDRTFSATDMLDMVLDFHSVDPSSAPQLTLPVQVDQFGSYTYKGGAYGDIEFPSNVQDDRVIDQFLGVGPGIDTLTGKPLPVPSTVTVSVLNGSGVTNQATDTSNALGALGYKMVGLGDTTPVGTEAETVVYFAQKTPADEAAAEAVARSMSGAVITALGPTTDGAQVTVVTGTQFTVNPPAPAAAAPTGGPTTTVAGTSGSTASTASVPTTPAPTTTTTSPTSADFQSASAAVTPLQPWDPRACPNP